MTQAEFSRFSEFIIGQCGIKMPPSKKIMLEARLQKRAKAAYGVSIVVWPSMVMKPPARMKVCEGFAATIE